MPFPFDIMSALNRQHPLGWERLMPAPTLFQQFQLANAVGGFGMQSVFPTELSTATMMGIDLREALGLSTVLVMKDLHLELGAMAGLAPWARIADAHAPWSEVTRGLLPSHWRVDTFDTDVFRERLRRFAEIARILGWPPPMRMRSSLIGVVLELFDDSAMGARAEIEALFIDEFDDETLATMVTDWRGRPWVARHVDTMIEAVTAYKHELYRASIYTAIPMVEALVIDAMSVPSASHRDIKSFVQRAIGAHAAADADRALASYIRDHHFATFRRGDRIPDTPARHAVTHGAHPAVGTRANALRVLILLDLVQDALAFVAAPRGRVVHLPSCSRGQRIRFDRRRVFRTLGEAAAAGLPLGPCCPAATTP